MIGKGKWVAVWLIAVMLVVTACTGTAQKEEPNPTKKEGSPATPAASEDPYQFPLKEPVELTFFGGKYELVQKDYSEMSVFKEMERRSNVKINWNLTSNWNEQYNLMIASGDLPDAFFGRMGFSPSHLVELSGQGLLVPLDDLIEEHAPNIKKFFEQYPDAKANFLTPDGKLYTIPTVFYFDHHRIGTRMFINEKWLQQISRDVPVTTEEFYEVLKEFGERDMNGNGLKDEIPFTFQYPNGQRGPWGISSAFGITDMNHHKFVKDGKILFAPMEEGYKEYVKYLHRLKKEGLLDQEAFTHNTNSYIAKIRENPSTVGAFIGWVWSTYFDSKDASDYIALEPLEGPKGDRSFPHYPMTQLAGGLTITTKNPNPIATIKWFDMIFGDEELAYSMDLGPRGVTWDYSENGGLKFFDPPEGMVYEEFRHADSPGNGGPAYYTPEMYRSYAAGNKSIQESLIMYDIYKPYLDKEAVPNLIKSYEDNERVNQLTTDINGFVETQFAKWVFEGGVDEGWDAYLSQLKRLGVEEMMEIENRYYKKLLESQ